VTGRVVPVVWEPGGPEFKPQCHKKNKQTKPEFLQNHWKMGLGM
jgi:hypothetical protein